jgi:hypothetical protein
MVIMSNTIQAGWDFGQDDNIIDNLSTGTTSSFKRSEIPRKNDGDKSYSIIWQKQHIPTKKDGRRLGQERRNQRTITTMQHQPNQSSRELTEILT